MKKKTSITYPLIKYPEIEPLNYYKHVAQYLLKFLSNRKLTVIWQRNDKVGLAKVIKTKTGSRKPITVNNEIELLKLIKNGVIDLMFSVKSDEKNVVDVYVVDIKADKSVWIHEKNWLILDLVVQIVNNYLTYLGIDSKLTYFDGMNGFKVIALMKITEDINPREFRIILSKSIELLDEIFTRCIKKYKEIYEPLDLKNHLVIGGNTMLKVGACRTPLSMHWSTKLIAIPLVNSVKDFSIMHTRPRYVLDKLFMYASVIESMWRENDISTFVKIIQQYLSNNFTIIYEVKRYVLSNISLEK